MTMILDPTAEASPIRRTLTSVDPNRLKSVAFLDISKPKGSILLDRLEKRIRQEIPGLTIERYAKPAFTKPAPLDLRNRISSHHQLVILALAD